MDACSSGGSAISLAGRLIQRWQRETVICAVLDSKRVAFCSPPMASAVPDSTIATTAAAVTAVDGFMERTKDKGLEKTTLFCWRRPVA